MTIPNMTPEQEVAEVRKLFITAITDGLRDKPTPAFLTVVQRFLASEQALLPLTPPASPETQAATQIAERKLPFPIKNTPPAANSSTTANNSEKKPEAWAALKTPFNTDADF